MNKYEITFITKEDLKAEPVKKEIESLGGKIGVVNNVGQKQLTYPIKKETAGYYTAVEFELEGEKVLELNKKLSLKNEILRHLIITAKAVKIEAPVEKKEKKVEVTAIAEPRPEAIEIAPEKAITEPLPTEIKEVEKPAEKASEEDKTEKPKKMAAKPLDETRGKSAKQAEADAKEESVSTEDRLKALDEKLDELLKE